MHRHQLNNSTRTTNNKMNSFAIVAFIAALACVNAGYIAAPSAKILQGPSSKTTIVGPDGSAISAVAPGGQIITEEHPGVVAHTAPVVAHAAYAAPIAAHAAYAAPIAAYAAPIAYSHGAYAAPALAHHGLVAHAAPIAYGAHHGIDTLVAGPSGTIATSKTVAAPVYGHHLAYGHHGLYL